MDDPAGRTKAKREHRVPLSRRSARILDAARALDHGRSPLVFPSRDGRPIGVTRLPKLLQGNKIAAVPHGFRSSFRDWAAEEMNHPAGSDRSGAGARRDEPDRGGVRALGPVRAAAAAHERVGDLP